MVDDSSFAGEQRVIVELVGVPGAGKSTLLRPLADALQAIPLDLTASSGITGRSIGRPRRLIQAINSGFRNRPLAIVVMASAKDRHRLVLALEILRREWSVRRLRRMSNDYVIDEGPVQRLIGYLSLAPQKDCSVGPLGATMNLPDVIVKLPLATDIALDRIYNRNTVNSFSQLSQPMARTALERFEVLSSHIISELNIPVVEGHTDLENLARKVIAIRQ